MTKKIAYRRDAFTLVEMLVVIAIILAIAALAAAFAPRVNDNQKLTRAVDNLEQWLLTAKMRAKRDGLATGIRFVQAPGDTAGTYSQVQYIQQPEPLTGGWISPTIINGNSVLAPPPFVVTPSPLYVSGGILLQTPNPNTLLPAGTLTNPLPSTLSPPVVLATGQVQIYNFDPTLGNGPASLATQWLVQPGDYLEINGGGVYSIAGVVTSNGLNLPGVIPVTTTPSWWVAGVPVTTIQLTDSGVPLSYGNSLVIPPPGTTNYRIRRQPRILIGEEPLTLPTNYAVVVNPVVTFKNTFNVPDISPVPIPTCNVLPGSSGNFEILFSPSGAVVGSNAANSLIWVSVWDTTMEYLDANRVGIVGIQSRSGFMGAYGVSVSGDPLSFVRTARESGL